MSLNIISKTSTMCTNIRSTKIEWIVFHYTAGTTSRSGSAINLASWYMSGKASASSDYIVDDTTIVQYNPNIKGRYTWGVGGNKYTNKFTSLSGRYYGKCTNMNCINIEVCSNKTNTKSLNADDSDWFFTEAELNMSAQLIKYLMKEYNIDLDHVIMHHEVTGKMCPAMWTRNEASLSGWYNFRNKLTSGTIGVSMPSVKPTTTQAEKYTLLVSLDGYLSAEDALNGLNPVKSYSPGEYYIYKKYNDSYNISTTENSAGAWINTKLNVKPVETKPVETETLKGEYPKIERGTTVISVSDVSKSGNKLVTGNSTFTYNNFKCASDNTLKVNKSLPPALEVLMKFMRMSKMNIVKGYLDEKTINGGIGPCKLLSRHEKGYAADVMCYDKDNNLIPSKYVCCAAQLLGFTGISQVPSNEITHLDVRSNSIWSIQHVNNGKDIRKAGYDDFFDYFNLTEADLNKYTGLNVGGPITEIPEVKVNTITEAATIIGKIEMPKDKIVKFIKSHNSSFDTSIADAFYTIAPIYGLRGDIALCQSIIETGYFIYAGSAVTSDQHNYCGLGVTANGVKGNAFQTVANGVEAQIQHLYAYGSKDDLPSGRTLYDPRYKYVTRGIAPRWVDLNMRWAMTNIYGQTIVKLYNEIATS